MKILHRLVSYMKCRDNEIYHVHGNTFIWQNILQPSSTEHTEREVQIVTDASRAATEILAVF